MLTNLPSFTARLMSCNTTNSHSKLGAGNRFVSLSIVMADAAKPSLEMTGGGSMH